MYKSERMMKAIGDISDDKIEKASRALGYQKERRQTSRLPIRMGRVLSIAAVLALILALGAVAYAVNLFGLRELYANPNRGDMPGEAANLIVSQSAEVKGDGWSASVPNLSGKLRRGTLRYLEAVELADALGYDIVWQRRKESR